MTNSKIAPLIGDDGEVREITADDMKFATRGRPPMLAEDRKKRVNITIDAGLLAAIDHTAKERGLTRSSFLADLAKQEIGA